MVLEGLTESWGRLGSVLGRIQITKTCETHLKINGLGIPGGSREGPKMTSKFEQSLVGQIYNWIHSGFVVEHPLG